MKPHIKEKKKKGKHTKRSFKLLISTVTTNIKCGPTSKQIINPHTKSLFT